MRTQLEGAVAAHYARNDLLQRILEGLVASGADPDALTPELLSPVDEFHTAGRGSTLLALAAMRLEPGMHVVDIGSGIGGTARCIATERGCRVTGLDLTPEYVDTARELTRRMRLDDACEFLNASALALPFADDAFDAAVSFHVAMNIEDRDLFYREVARVVKSGAEFCMFDVMKGPAPGMRYPVPWAETEATSFLKSRDETCGLLEQAGFEVTGEQNLTGYAKAFFEESFAKAAAAGGPPPLGLHILTGTDTAAKFGNYVAALEAGEIEPIILLARRR